ncbi:hypothetical protein GCM10008932_23490 [Alkalibacterium iburiense]|uniref:Zinc ribbon domain-containing protein n=2 Tax=Alkalibacterium iburiense TaxID=290589 RepID=A0ABN0XS43_9LACT
MMQYCKACQAQIKGNWSVCPLCQTSLERGTEELEESSFLPVSLRFNRKKVMKGFTLASFIVIVLYFVAHFIWRFRFFGLEYVLFGLMISWLMTVLLIRKRRNVVKGIVYVLIIFSLLSLYFDYVNGWLGWSVTFAIPILCIAAILAMFISIQLVDLKADDYILYLQLAAIVGIIPLLFLLMNWVGHPLPSALSVLFSVIITLIVLLKHGKKVKRELQKRMHV